MSNIYFKLYDFWLCMVAEHFQTNPELDNTTDRPITSHYESFV